jgi:mRNA interferase RelE/StbE
MKYEVVFAANIAKQLRRIDRKWQLKIVAAAESLGDNPRPHGCKKLVNEGGLYRIKVGDYRIIYEVIDKILLVSVLRVAKRNERTY